MAHSKTNSAADGLLQDRELLGHFLQWDVQTWKAALHAWHPIVGAMHNARVLDVGARDGGLTLYFALMGQEVVCSDLHGPSEDAKALHCRYGVANRIAYAAIDATRIAFPDNTFDVVCFKSVVGGIGALGIEYQRQAIAEMYRVLRPGGFLLFAENLQGNWLHRLLRQCFVKWGARWRYPNLTEMREFLQPFRSVQMNCHGVLAAFGRTESQRRGLHSVDVLLNKICPEQAKYMAAGIATK